MFCNLSVEISLKKILLFWGPYFICYVFIINQNLSIYEVALIVLIYQCLFSLSLFLWCGTANMLVSLCVKYVKCVKNFQGF